MGSQYCVCGDRNRVDHDTQSNTVTSRLFTDTYDHDGDQSTVATMDPCRIARHAPSLILRELVALLDIYALCSG